MKKDEMMKDAMQTELAAQPALDAVGEQLSALLDGELSADEARFVQRRMASDPALRARWARMQDNDTPERELLREEIAREVSQTVAGLPEELRTAITLREMDGLSYEEIAEAMDCPIGTVRSRIFRAREAIDARLRPLMDSERVRP